MIINSLAVPDIPLLTSGISKQVEIEAINRTYLASNQLRNAALKVLSGQRHGRVYSLPNSRGRKNKKYTASAPGESPAVRLGHLRASWQIRTSFTPGALREHRFVASIASRYATQDGRWNIPNLLEGGTGKMEPRPFHQKILDLALDGIVRIFKRPYVLK